MARAQIHKVCVLTTNTSRTPIIHHCRGTVVNFSTICSFIHFDSGFSSIKLSKWGGKSNASFFGQCQSVLPNENKTRAIGCRSNWESFCIDNIWHQSCCLCLHLFFSNEQLVTWNALSYCGDAYHMRSHQSTNRHFTRTKQLSVLFYCISLHFQMIIRREKMPLILSACFW